MSSDVTRRNFVVNYEILFDPPNHCIFVFNSWHIQIKYIYIYISCAFYFPKRSRNPGTLFKEKKKPLEESRGRFK